MHSDFWQYSLYSHVTGYTDALWIVMSDEIDGDLHLKGPIPNRLDHCVLVDVQADG